MTNPQAENWTDSAPRWIFKLSKRRFAQLGRWVEDLLDTETKRAREEERKRVDKQWAYISDDFGKIVSTVWFRDGNLQITSGKVDIEALKKSLEKGGSNYV